MKKVSFLVIILIITAMVCGTAYADSVGPIPTPSAPAGMSQQDYINAGGQGTEQFFTEEEMEQAWYNDLPVYSGTVITNNAISSLTSNDLNSANINQKTSIAVALKQVQNIAKSQQDDYKFKHWVNCSLTQPVSIYSCNDQLGAYMFGVVDSNKKIVGYIVAGANIKLPPIMEYSTSTVKYMDMANKAANNMKIYFDPNCQYIYASNTQGGTAHALNTNASVVKPNATFINQPEIGQEWTQTLSSLQSQVSGVQPMTNGVQTYLSNTSDFDYHNICSSTAGAMFIDYIGRRYDPSLLVGRPFSVEINDLLHYSYFGGGTFGEIKTGIVTYFNAYRTNSNLSLSSYMMDATNGSYTNSQLFQEHKVQINNGMPTQVGFCEYDTTGKCIECHIMLGIGYTSFNYYITRDTWGADATPIDDNFYYDQYLYKYVLIYFNLSDSSPSTDWGDVTLRLGSNNYNVKQLENMLYALYYNPGTIDNVFDTNTQNAVKAFQADFGLTADGIVGPNTYAKLKNAHMFKYDSTITARTLSSGKKGDDVAQLECRLQGADPSNPIFYSGALDGIFGPQLTAAVKAFQTANGLTSDGIVGPATYDMLTYHIWSH